MTFKLSRVSIERDPSSIKGVPTLKAVVSEEDAGEEKVINMSTSEESEGSTKPSNSGFFSFIKKVDSGGLQSIPYEEDEDTETADDVEGGASKDEVIGKQEKSSSALGFFSFKLSRGNSTPTASSTVDQSESEIEHQEIENIDQQEGIHDTVEATNGEVAASTIGASQTKQSSGFFRRVRGSPVTVDTSFAAATAPISKSEKSEIVDNLSELAPEEVSLNEQEKLSEKQSKFFSFRKNKRSDSASSPTLQVIKQSCPPLTPNRVRAPTEDTVATLIDDLSIKTDDAHTPVHRSSNRQRRRGNVNRRDRNSNKNHVPLEQLREPILNHTKPHDAPMTKGDLYFALDCEMVGVGEEGLDSALARVCIVNWENEVVLDTFVKVTCPITDYRTYVSGITRENLENDGAIEFAEARQAVKSILNGKILIGHALENDLNVLRLTHPWCDTRDTATYTPFMRDAMDQATKQVTMRPRKLRDLAWESLRRQIQQEGIAHSPIEDALAALDLYKSIRREWETELAKESMEKTRLEENQRLQMYQSHQVYAGHSQSPHSHVNMHHQQQHAAAMHAYNNTHGIARPLRQHDPRVPVPPAGYNMNANTGLIQPPPAYHSGSYNSNGPPQASPQQMHYGAPMPPSTPPRSSFGFVPVYMSRGRRRRIRNAQNREEILPENVYVDPMSTQQ